jgi:hypothetical protein
VVNVFVYVVPGAVLEEVRLIFWLQDSSPSLGEMKLQMQLRRQALETRPIRNDSTRRKDFTNTVVSTGQIVVYVSMT